jgi:hypothetical protein
MCTRQFGECSNHPAPASDSIECPCVCVGGKHSGRIDPAGGSETWPTTHPPTPFPRRKEHTPRKLEMSNFGFVKRQNDINIAIFPEIVLLFRTKIFTHQSSPSVVERKESAAERQAACVAGGGVTPWSSHALRCCSWPVRCSQKPHVTAPLNMRAAFCSHSSVYEAVRVYVRACVAWCDGRHGTQLLFAATPCLCSRAPSPQERTSSDVCVHRSKLRLLLLFGCGL